MPGQLVTRSIFELLWYTSSSNFLTNGWQGLGSILMLHRIGEPKKSKFSPNRHLSVSPAFLDELLFELTCSEFQFVSMDYACEAISAKPREQGQKPFLSVTLDDGYRDNLKLAVPLFRKYNIPYTIYIAPGLVDGRATLWWEDLENLIASKQSLHFDWQGKRREFDLSTTRNKRQAFDELLKYLTSGVDEHQQREVINGLCKMHGIDVEENRKNSIMTWEELRQLSQDPLCTLGAHTIGHYAIARLSENQARLEFEQSRNLIEQEVGKRPQHFAYPYGYSEAAGKREFDMAADCGFKSAVTTRHGVIFPEHADHLTALPRISLNGNFQKTRYVQTMISGATTRLANKGRKLNLN